MSPKMILVVLAIILAALSYWIPQTLGAAVIILAASELIK